MYFVKSLELGSGRSEVKLEISQAAESQALMSLLDSSVRQGCLKITTSHNVSARPLFSSSLGTNVAARRNIQASVSARRTCARSLRAAELPTGKTDDYTGRLSDTFIRFARLSSARALVNANKCKWGAALVCAVSFLPSVPLVEAGSLTDDVITVELNENFRKVSAEQQQRRARKSASSRSKTPRSAA